MTESLAARETRVAVWETALVFALACAVNLSYLDHTPQWDELYHVLAAEGWLDSGVFRIADGEYSRAWGFTWLVSWLVSPERFGFVAARVPAALSGAAVCALLFFATTRAAGRRAGWIAALLLLTFPVGIYLSQLVRFYTAQSLLFMLAALCVLRLSRLEDSLRGGLLWGGVTVAALALASHLQPITLIGVAGLLLFVGLKVVLPWALGEVSAGRGWRVGVVALGLLGAAGLVLALGVLQESWAMYRTAPYWSLEGAADRRYYDRLLVDTYPTLWTLLPISVLLAARRHGPFALLCASIFGVGFIAHSLAAAKAPRFFYHVMPFFFALSGIAIAEALPLLRQLAVEGLRGLVGRDPGPSIRLWVGRASVVAVGLFVLLTNPAFRDSLRMLALTDAEWADGARFRGFPDWARAQPGLSPLAAQAEVLLTSSGVKALYYLDRLDYDVSRTLRDETDTLGEFGIDPKTGRRVITAPESLARVMDEHGSGLVVIESRRWRRPHNVPDAFADYLEAHATRLDTPESWRLLVFKWGNIEAPGEPAPENP